MLTTIPQAAETVGIDAQTVRRAVREGLIPYERVGRGDRAPFLVQESDVEAWAETYRAEKQRQAERVARRKKASRSPLAPDEQDHG